MFVLKRWRLVSSLFTWASLDGRHRSDFQAECSSLTKFCAFSRSSCPEYTSTYDTSRGVTRKNPRLVMYFCPPVLPRVTPIALFVVLSVVGNFRGTRRRRRKRRCWRRWDGRASWTGRRSTQSRWTLNIPPDAVLNRWQTEISPVLV